MHFRQEQLFYSVQTDIAVPFGHVPYLGHFKTYEKIRPDASYSVRSGTKSRPAVGCFIQFVYQLMYLNR